MAPLRVADIIALDEWDRRWAILHGATEEQARTATLVMVEDRPTPWEVQCEGGFSTPVSYQTFDERMSKRTVRP